MKTCKRKDCAQTWTPGWDDNDSDYCPMHQCHSLNVWHCGRDSQIERMAYCKRPATELNLSSPEDDDVTGRCKKHSDPGRVIGIIDRKGHWVITDRHHPFAGTYANIAQLYWCANIPNQ